MPSLRKAASVGSTIFTAICACSSGVAKGAGAVGAHAAGVRALVAVPQLLVVLRDGQDDVRDAVGQHVDRHLAPGQEFLDHELAPGVAEDALVHDAVDGLRGLDAASPR